MAKATRIVKSLSLLGTLFPIIAHAAPKAAAAPKVPNYTPEQTAKIVGDYVANPSSATVEALAKDYGKTVRSIVAKLSREGVYKKKEYTTKNGEPVVKKDEHADAIGAVLKLTEAETDSLTKANKTALAKIFAALANSKPIDGADDAIEAAGEKAGE